MLLLGFQSTNRLHIHYTIEIEDIPHVHSVRAPVGGNSVLDRRVDRIRW